jgi:hypothetical protein
MRNAIKKETSWKPTPPDVSHLHREVGYHAARTMSAMCMDESGTGVLGMHVSAIFTTWYAHSVSQLQRHLACWANDAPPSLSQIAVYTSSSEHARMEISSQRRINRTPVAQSVSPNSSEQAHVKQWLNKQSMTKKLITILGITGTQVCSEPFHHLCISIQTRTDGYSRVAQSPVDSFPTMSGGYVG